jgi:hypothetical protein
VPLAVTMLLLTSTDVDSTMTGIHFNINLNCGHLSRPRDRNRKMEYVHAIPGRPGVCGVSGIDVGWRRNLLETRARLSPARPSNRRVSDT